MADCSMAILYFCSLDEYHQDNRKPYGKRADKQQAPSCIAAQYRVAVILDTVPGASLYISSYPLVAVDQPKDEERSYQLPL
jgi:hypothetical protein